jgi:cytochrome c553
MTRLTVGTILFVALAACGDRQPPTETSAPTAAVAGDTAAGQLVAQKSCFACHRADGAGAAPGIPQLARQNPTYLVDAIQQYATGKRHHAVLQEMTPQLSESDIRNLAAFYASLPLPAAAPAAVPDARSLYERGKAAAAACESCHGPGGNSTIAGTPSLAGQQPIYLLAALAEYHRGDRATPGLQTMLSETDRVELEALALYYATQMPASRSAVAIGDPATGESLALRCTGCHGARGVGNDAATPMLAGQDAEYLAKALGNYGKARHHASMQRQMGDLAEQEIRDIAAYYAAQKGRPALSTQDPVAQTAAQCDRCHGDTAAAATPVPRIRGQDRDYLVMALRAYRDDRRESSAMHKMTMPFSEAAIHGLAAHYAAAQPAK